MNTATEKILWDTGWQIDCYSPLEISHEEYESRANGVAAEMVIELLRREKAELDEAPKVRIYRGEEDDMAAIELSAEERELVLKHRKEKDKAKAKAWRPKTDYTDAEKIAEFDRLHKMALGMWEEYQKDYCEDNDDDHWCYEAVMELLGDGVWEAIRAVQK